ncbi:ABC transporter substrate-binding protein [Halorhodospira halochloris]|uniref:Iron(III) ABC transporter n=1 Tax=Halorhodospira halochloris TaxID=1052 RepID=A0A0X8X8W4_HALHR|nr:ABC transporter substrate-binding protein [Halorhodospira halochloris]MBK1651335.1 hypothetical protein [Halorhodospira halochloris]MCG5529876.1 ABC transporter substrate-binding protein [Halorhodospira halochloris]MCG5547620.1 ABC transporter substrate-binding protein [Halorhodospira halochloris]BAU57620.1 iron(III) ABC transporter [Halorhodospira halochloris]
MQPKQRRLPSWIAIPVGALLLLWASTGCDDFKPTEQATPDVESSSETQTVEDMLGRSVEIPAEVERVATVNVDAFRMTLHLDAGEKLVGIPSDMFGSRFSEDKTIEARAFDGLENTPKIGGGQPGSEISLEKIVSVEPDVFLFWAFSRGDSAEAMANRADQIQQQLGIPVIAVNTLGRDREEEQIYAEIEQAYQLMGAVLDREERASSLVEDYFTEVEQIQERIAEHRKSAAAEQGKEAQELAAPRVYMAHRSNLFNNVAFYLPIEQLDADNVATARRGRDGEISAEQLLAWDPEYIFLHTPSQTSRVAASEIGEDSSLAQISAVQDGNIYRFKGTYMGWDLATGLIDLIHMGKILYPEAFDDIDTAQRGEQILNKFYGQEGLFEHLNEQSSLLENTSK